MQTHRVSGGSGVRLHVRECGRADGPAVLFIHGWSQNHLCWKQQFDGPLADDFRLVAFDLRGHGMSDKPEGAEPYSNGRLWADDVAAVVEHLGLDRPLLVGWSYGGVIIGDYVRAYGQERIAGINLVGAAVSLGRDAPIGPGFLDTFEAATADDLATNIEAMRRFVRACTAKPLPAGLYEEALCWNIVVPARVRAAMVQREVRFDDVLNDLAVPVLVTQGDRDTVILPATAEHVLATCPMAKVSWYAGIGHMPFVEDTARFNAELADFAGSIHGLRQPS